MDINKIKDLHNKRVGVERQTGSFTTPDYDTAYNCLNRARKRMSKVLPDNVGEESIEMALDSFDGVEIFTVWEEGDKTEQRAIVKNLKDNWQQDTKYVSATKSSGFELGNTVTWKRLNIRWLLVWQDFIYKDYFRGEMYRANYLIKWIDDKGKKQEQWASVRGPVETKAKVDNVAGDYMGGRQNDSLELWTSKNHGAADSLYRYELIRLEGRTWRIHVVDDVSNPNIIRMSLIENFNNDINDDIIEGIPDGKIIMPEETFPPADDYKIVGPNTIKEGLSGTFKVYNNSEPVLGNWTVLNQNKNTTQTFANLSEITFKGGKVGDIFIISFEDKVQVQVRTVSVFS